MTNQSTTDRSISQINPPKQTSRYLVYLANLFLTQSTKRLFRWRQISPPLNLETLMATFWVPETTKRPRCIMVSDKGSLMKERNFDQLVLAVLNWAHRSHWTYSLSLSLSLALSLPFGFLFWDALLLSAFAVAGLLLVEAVQGLVVLLLVGITFFFTAFWPASASSAELSDEEELELLTAFLAAGFCPDTVLFCAAVHDLTGSAGLFPLLVVVGLAGVLSGFCFAVALSLELEEEEKEAGGGFADLLLKGLFPDALALLIGVDDLGGCAGLFHLLPEGPGTGIPVREDLLTAGRSLTSAPLSRDRP